MRYNILTILFLIGGLWSATGQNIKGKILGDNQEALGSANVYVRETRQGAVTNDKGEFQLNLPNGTYTLEISFLGYEKQIKQIEAGDKVTNLNIVLEQAAIMLPVVRVSNKKEDESYDVMRRAISRAPFHRSQVERYSAEVYTKGRGRVDKIPKVYLMGLSAAERKEVNELMGKLLVLESVVNVDFKAPENYKSTVVAYTSSLPEQFDTQAALSIITASIYDPMIIGIISPLAPGAFSQYNFHLVESYYQDNKMVSKIKVEPKRNNAQLFGGELYIEEEGFSVIAFNLTANVFDTDARFKASYHEVSPEVYLPTTYDISADVKILGVKAQARYYSSLKYKNVVASTSNHFAAPSQSAKTESAELSAKHKKSMEKLDELSKKEFVSTREAYKMAKLTQDIIDETKLSAPPSESSEVNPLGVSIKAIENKEVVVQDTAIWAEIRTIPLDEDEIASYASTLTFPSIGNSSGGNGESANTESVTKKKRNVNIPGLLLGDKHNFGKIRLNYDGLLFSVPEYNFVDGFWIGQGFDISFDINSYRRLEISPSLYYTTARKKLAWDVEIKSPTFARVNGLLMLRAGDKTMDFKQAAGTWRLENALTSLVAGDNYMKFYRSQYVELYHRMDLYEGLRFEVLGRYQHRNVLSNNTKYNFFNRDVEENIPVANNQTYLMPNNESAKLKAALSYSPKHKVNANRHSYFKKTEWPSVSASYEWGIPIGTGATSNFHKVELGLSQTFKPSFFSRFTWNVQAGKFFSVKEIYLPDYKQFGTSGWIMNNDSFKRNFFMNDYYSFATADKWIWANINFSSSYLAIKNLPFLQEYPFDEMLHLRYLWTPNQKHYMELGYSVGIKSFGRFGVFANFNQMKIDAVAFRMYLPLEFLIKL